MSTPGRVQAGVPAGGQFASAVHAEAEGSLVDLEVDWGTVSISEGSRSPWGRCDSVEELAPGVVAVSTASHGGIKLSPERNRAVPPALRRASGWYEEDCEAYIVGFAHPDTIRSGLDHSRYVEGVKEWFPDGYEKVTGEPVTADDSRLVAEREWLEAHRGELVAVSAAPIRDEPGWVAVTVEASGLDGPRRVLKVPRDRYLDSDLREPHGKYPGRWVVPGDGFDDITPPEKPPEPPAPVFRGVNTSGLSAHQVGLVHRDLQRRWRDDSGEVATLAEWIERDGLTGKSVIVNSSTATREYHLTGPEAANGGYVAYPVSKATWDAVEAPDKRSPVRRAQDDLIYAEARVYKLANSRTATDEQRLRARDAHREALQRLADASHNEGRGG